MKKIMIVTAMTLTASFALACGGQYGGRLGDTSGVATKKNQQDSSTTNSGSGNAETKSKSHGG